MRHYLFDKYGDGYGIFFSYPAAVQEAIRLELEDGWYTTDGS